MNVSARRATSGHGRRAVLAACAACLLGVAAPRARANAHDGPDDVYLIAADQASHRVLVIGCARDGVAAVVRWSWSAVSDPLLADLDPAHTWRNVSEAKVRVLDGRGLLLAGASEGLAVALTYPQAEVLWATVIPTLNVHSLEVLPEGNVAVAASDPGVVRVYAAALGPRSEAFVSFDLPGAHGVYWDQARGVLWAVGYSDLVALQVGGTTSAPTLTLVLRVALPDPSGHDLDRVAADPSRLWVTTGGHVWQYDADAGQFVGYAGRSAIDTAGVKSVGDNPLTGRVLTVQPEPGNACTWCTSSVALHLPEDTVRLPGASLYKARWLLR
ncbi:MAG TPA: DUF6528 family protein [Thermoleophilia bacterium]|jgi:hypothetical protein|nr:DUF6528 family protein [Thermoleophilia bacterium]